MENVAVKQRQCVRVSVCVCKISAQHADVPENWHRTATTRHVWHLMQSNKLTSCSYNSYFKWKQIYDGIAMVTVFFSPIQVMQIMILVQSVHVLACSFKNVRKK